MKILFIGDIVGSPGRRAVKHLVPVLNSIHRIDVVIANGENSAGGSGITKAIAEELFSYGVDVITSGDHVWDQRETPALLQSEPRCLRPGNYPSETPGAGHYILYKGDLPPVAVLNAQGRTFMKDADNPFEWIQNAVADVLKTTRIMIVDFHAEATSEKIAFGRMLDGFVSAVVGTHTHVQTADEQVFPNGTAFLCDAGFTGAHESILGREIQPIIQKFVTYQPQKFEVAKKDIRLSGALIEVDESTGHAVSIQRISEKLSIEK